MPTSYMGVALALLFNVAAASMGATQQDDWAAADTADAEEVLNAIMRNMTVASALQTLGSRLPHDVESLARRGQVGLRGRRSAGLLQTAPSPEDAAPALNQMIQETRAKLDMEYIRCSEYKASQLQLIESTRLSVEKFNAFGAAARGHILQSEGHIGTAEKSLPQLTRSLEQEDHKCTTAEATLQQQIAIAEKDYRTVDVMIKKMKCQASMMLLQCQEPTGASFITFGRRALQRKMAQPMSSSVMQALQEGLQEVYARAKVPTKGPTSLLMVSHKHRSHPHRRGHQSLIAHGRFVKQMPVLTNATDDPPKKKAQRKCAMKEKPDCPFMFERMAQIQTTVLDKAVELKRQLEVLQGNCAKTVSTLKEQIKGQSLLLSEGQTDLATSSKDQAGAEEQSRLKSSELEGLNSDYTHMMQECTVSTRELQKELCATRKIRAEIEKMADTKKNLVDCQVTAWQPQECPVTCGGGVQKLTRSMSVFPQGGASCPPLEMERKCNQEPCPVACQLDVWSGWSTCSALCGGGVKQRQRTVLVQPQHNGESCGDITESQECNVQSCDRDCELSRWSAWSACSQACGGGLMEKTRAVRRAASGGGKCPAEDSKSRLMFKKCNVQPCVPPPGKPTIQCRSKLDVILLFGGSASLGKDGWNAMKKAGKMFVEAFEGSKGDIRVASILFSGPKNYKQLKNCQGGKGDLEKDCGTKWVSHLTDDIKTVADDIKGMKWPQGPSFTSTALAAATGELHASRPDVQSVVVVITNGRPMSPVKTGQISAKLREKARLVWVPVTTYAPISQIKKWSSKPVRENVIQVKDFKTLMQPATISTLIAGICSDVAVGPSPAQP
eukprot:gnl/TRDRNA2_/TRDRNA2_83990_c0_seq1.p1 gnl/TRDRNA2_/TRDRNA2_83990_c0~~gnl/TRDRNA2_/TRDRNA2_83990_c0_seq1.p1  ORF type:complete len:838 (-),score=170.62 gnl/TRDRNA2_/TRDRNA2_83990_c0_seq1:60-2573(-)